MSLGLVVLEKKLFTRTRTPMPQSDDIKVTSACVTAYELSPHVFLDNLKDFVNTDLCMG